MDEPLINDNKWLNEKCHKDIAEKENKRFYFIRSGKCQPERCQSLCCRIRVSKEEKQFTNALREFDIIREVDGVNYLIEFKSCRYMTLDGKCKLHNKKEQIRICRYFPMSPKDPHYQVVKEFCGFMFTEHENKKYRLIKKD